MRRWATMVLGSVAAVALVASPTASSHGPRGHSGAAQVLEFDTMAAVSGPFVGSGNPIRGINGGGLPWQVDEANGELAADGRLEVEVRGLVLFDGPPVPEANQGINPVPAFRAVVSCESIVDGAAAVVNVATDPVSASRGGDAKIEATVDLPSPCLAPVVFVGPSPATWFAATGLG